MNILMILENEFPFDERVEKEALSLIKAGHQVSIACATLAEKPAAEDYKGIHILRTPSNPFYYKKARTACLTLPFYFNFWSKFIRSILDKKKYDVIHVHDLPLAQVGLQLSKKYNTRLTLDFHENYPYMLKEESYTQTLTGKLLAPISKWIKYEKKTLKALDNAVCVCDEMAARMNQINPALSFHVLDNTLNIKDYKTPKEIEKTNTPNPVKLVYVGGFTIKRGIEVAIKGIALANKEGKTQFQLDLYGSGRKEYMDSLIALAQSEGVADDVNYKGYLKLPADAEKLMSYDIGLIPHLKNTHTDNTSPNKIFHYYYYKLPVMCSDCNYLKRIVDETKGGFYYQNDSPEDFAKKLLNFHSQHDYTNYGEAGYQSILSKYNWENRVNNLLKLYEE